MKIADTWEWLWDYPDTHPADEMVSVYNDDLLKLSRAYADRDFHYCDRCGIQFKETLEVPGSELLGGCDYCNKCRAVIRGRVSRMSTDDRHRCPINPEGIIFGEGLTFSGQIPYRLWRKRNK